MYSSLNVDYIYNMIKFDYSILLIYVIPVGSQKQFGV